MVAKWVFETETVMKQHDVTTMALSGGAAPLKPQNWQPHFYLVNRVLP